MTMPLLVIISGHSSGLGRALAEHYLQQHHGRVWGLSRRLWAQPPQGLRQTALDLADTAALRTFLADNAWRAAVQAAAAVILINNAGSVEPNALLGQQDALHISHTVALNVTAPLLLSNALLALTAASQDVRIAHISSGAARKAYAGWSVYAATKAALDQHAQVVAAEQRVGLRIASIAPGVVNTDMQALIRVSNAAVFPLRERFVDMYEHGQLQDAAATAKQIAAMIADEAYGRVVLRDVRE